MIYLLGLAALIAVAIAFFGGYVRGYSAGFDDGIEPFFRTSYSPPGGDLE